MALLRAATRARVSRYCTSLRTSHLLGKAFSSTSTEGSCISLMYPGQGSQFVGMGKDIAQEFPLATKVVYDEIEDSLQQQLSSLMFYGQEEELHRTENTQPAVYTHALAIQQVLSQELGLDLGEDNSEHSISSILGHSVGEFSALGAAGAFGDIGSGAKLLGLRGKVMQRAADKEVERSGKDLGMMALIVNQHTDSAFRDILDRVDQKCHEISDQGLVASLANINSPRQVVISGHNECLKQVSEILKNEGLISRGVSMRRVSAPFHCSLMKPAADALDLAFVYKEESNSNPHELWQNLHDHLDESELEGVDLGLEGIVQRWISNVDASVTKSTEDMTRKLVDQVTSPVDWVGCVRFAHTLQNCQEPFFLEIGGEAVGSFVKQTMPEGCRAYSINTVDHLKSFLRSVDNEGSMVGAIKALTEE